MTRALILLLSVNIFAGCHFPNKQNDKWLSGENEDSIRFAYGFNINHSGSYTVLTVRNPWQHASGIQYTFILSDTIKKSARVNANTWKIRTPVTKVICLSTTHIGFINDIGKAASIQGISGKQYVVNDAVRKGISENRIFDVGYDENLSYELILKLSPDVVFAYGVDVSVTNTVRKLNELGIPVILIGEYLEQDPLGKMEWIKAFAACYNLENMASAIFDSVVNRYTELKILASKANPKPTVLLGLPWRGTWYVSGSKSYIARLVSDAGGKYIWSHLDFNESRPLSLEKIFENAITAEFWINPGEARSREDIISVDERFGTLPSLNNGFVYNNDHQLTEAGGNDFYESGVVEPHIILSDLISILHPHLLPSHELKYYRKLQ